MKKKDEMNPKAEQTEVSAGEEHLAEEGAELTTKDNNEESAKQPEAVTETGESSAELTSESVKEEKKDEAETPPADEKSEAEAVESADAEADEVVSEMEAEAPQAEEQEVAETPPADEKPEAEAVESADAEADEVVSEVEAEAPQAEEQEVAETSPADEKPEAEAVESADAEADEVVSEMEAEAPQAEEQEVAEAPPADEKPEAEAVESADAEADKVVSEVEAEAPQAEEQEVTEAPEVVDKPLEVKSEEDSDDTEALSEKYGAMDREALVATIESLVESDDVNYIRKHIGFIKVAYRKLLRDENMAVYEQRLAKGKDEAEEEQRVDRLSERFDNAFNIYKDKKAAWDRALEKEMQENLVLKEEILEELRKLIDSEEELKKTYDQFNELQERWRAIGAVPRGSKSTLWNNYHFLVEKFFDKVNINKELKDLDLKKNLEAKTELCEKAEELFLETSITRSFQQLQKLHEAWKETGPVPKDKKDEIWDRFRSATEKLNKRRQEYYDKLREEQNKNYAAKLVLCEKAEELLTVIPETPRQWQEKTNQINELFKVWKTVGFAPKKVNNDIWNRFRGALDTFFANKKEFFKKYKDQQKENYNEKLNLCLQAEALKDSEDWRSTTEALINLQNEWKKIGPVPAKFSDKIWKRFRQACDQFFNKKSAHFSNIGEQQNKNLNEKLALIEQIKTYNYSDDNKANLDVLKDFQRKWMDLGHVPIKQKDKVQSEFRKAIDHQFEILNISKKAKSTLSFRTKIENLKGVQNADAIIQKERNFITAKIKNLESDIKVLENNIGFFASSKKADLLKAEFEEKIDKARTEIGVLKEKMKILRES